MLPIDRQFCKWAMLLLAFGLGLMGAKVMLEPVVAQRAGRLKAEESIAAQEWRLKIGGKMQPWRQDVERLALREYGIEVDHAYDCCPTSYQMSYCNGYNARMTFEIQRMDPSFSMETLLAAAHESWSREQGR